MPLVRCETNQHLNDSQKTQLCTELSHICAEVIGKPETYVQAVVQDGLTLLHGGKPGPAAFVDVRSIGGLSGKTNATLAEKICTVISKTAAVPGARIYLNFTDVAASHWGHDGATFG
jgi:phenylpyruvate tautomerase